MFDTRRGPKANLADFKGGRFLLNLWRHGAFRAAGNARRSTG